MLSVQTKPFFFLKTIMRTTDSATPDQADETVTDSTETSIIPSTSNVILVQPSTSKSMLAQKSSDLALNKDRDCSVQQIILLPVPNVSSDEIVGSSHQSTEDKLETVNVVDEGFQRGSVIGGSTSGASPNIVTNATYVYASDYPPYYQYQPIQSPSQQTYIIQQQNSPGSVDEENATQLGHTARASPATIQWLINNYETADGTSLPRCTLYSHYIRHCNENKLEPVNAASFGKLIRSVFLGLRTRRLGTRGNSKYHYYGIRIKPDSPLNRGLGVNTNANDEYTRQTIVEQNVHVNQTPLRSSSRRPTNGCLSARGSNIGIPDSAAPQSRSALSSTSPSPGCVPNAHTGHAHSYRSYHNRSSSSSINEETPADVDREILGDGEVPQVQLPDMQGLENFLQPLGLNIRHATKFIEGYSNNCRDVLECVKQLQFDAVEECWSNFWQPENDQDDLDEDECAPEEKASKGLTQLQLFRLCTVPQMQTFVQNMDLAFYQVIIEVLIPDVLSSSMTSTLTTQIRNFAKSLEVQMKKALQGAPDPFLKKKLATARTLAHTLRRYTSLNHLATAARGVLQKADQIQQMYQDFNRVDITNVQEQAGWVCDCDPVLVSNLQSDFRENLQKQKSLEEWAEWMEAVVDQVLAKYHDKPVSVLAEVSKQFLKNWSFYSSMIIRDLTLRSAQSFGSFHLIRLLYDEYLLYLVELRLAKAANKHVISIMAQAGDAYGQTSPTTIVSQSTLNNNVGMMSMHAPHQIYQTISASGDVNIVYVDERTSQPQEIHYVEMISGGQLDTLEQIVQRSDMSLKDDMDDGSKTIGIM